MKKYIFSVLVIAGLVAGCSSTKELTVLHTNDTHSQIYPLSANLADTMKAGRGGFLRRIAMLKEERKKDKDLLLFDSGDFSQGSTYYTMYKGDVEAGLMNMMCYDAGTIGNHEFDFGLDNMARLFKSLNFPIVCANYDFKGTPLDGIVKPYVIIKRKGLKIGVFGLDPELDGLVDAKNYGSIVYKDPIPVANQMGEMLKNKEKCDIVILLSHLGWNIEGVSDEEVIAGSRNIDVVLGGHSHSYLRKLAYVKNLDGKDIPVDQNGKHGIFIGKLQLTIQNRK